jgi:hypothetical protein
LEVSAIGAAQDPEGAAISRKDVKNEDCSGDVYENKCMNDKLTEY